MQRINLPSLSLRWTRTTATAPGGCSSRQQLHIRLASTTATAPARLDLQAIDAKWRQRWAAVEPAGPVPAQGSTGKPKCFVLPMFPYPSGALHMGHLRVYTIADVLARFKRMKGYDVIHPMGWDAFGLPAENAAIERGIDPEKWTRDNIAKMKEQLIEMNGSWDWTREFMTCDPSFYKHTQRIFLRLYKHGLAYQAKSLVNYDPVDKTVLANEQVDSNGCSWRSGAKVERRRLKQWFLRITAFKEALLQDLDILAKDGQWPERVVSMQKNWLGRSKGARVCFAVSVANEGMTVECSDVAAFTTMPHTLFGVQYLALGIDHPLVVKLAMSSPELQSFLDSAPTLPPDSKAGYFLKGVQATNPLAFLDDMPSTVKEPLPVYVAPYVIGHYGYGAVMGVPGHDNRDCAFWRENRGADLVRKVVAPANSKELCLEGELFRDCGVLTSLCGRFGGLSSSVASERIMLELQGVETNLGEFVESWKIRDWLISRQRYWGTPIPMIHCEDCGTVPVPEDQLPVELPKLEGGWLRGKGGNPLQDVPEWVNVKCPRCGGPARRDTDTMDTFVDSSWYFTRFPDPRNSEAPFSAQSAEASLPVDIYVGGVEHAILHLLYARFISKFLATTSLWPSGGGPTNKGEPFKKLVTQGMVHGKTYTDPATGRFLGTAEIDLTTDPRFPKFVLPDGARVNANVSYEKMSKSKHNGVDPGDCIRKYGADATRAHVLFSAPVSEVLEWDEEKIVGVQRWFGRVWKVVGDVARLLAATQSTPSDRADPLDRAASPPLSPMEVRLQATLQHTIRNVTASLEGAYGLNTIVSSLMELTNNIISTHCGSNPETTQHALSILLRLLAPIAPAFTSECWEILHSSPTCRRQINSIFHAPWPTASFPASPSTTKTELTCAVQINGKLRFVTKLSPGPPDGLAGEALREWLVARLVGGEAGGKWLGEGKANAARRVVVVGGGKVVNFVF